MSKILKKTIREKCVLSRARIFLGYRYNLYFSSRESDTHLISLRVKILGELFQIGPIAVSTERFKPTFTSMVDSLYYFVNNYFNNKINNNKTL